MAERWNGTAEVRYIGRLGKLLDAMPEDAALRALAFLVSRQLGVGACRISDDLYEAAADAREKARAMSGAELAAKHGFKPHGRDPLTGATRSGGQES